MQTCFLPHTLPYDGRQLRSLWCYEQTNEPGDCIIAFIGAMDVSTHMVDMEDVLQCDYIKSTLALNFIVELFHINLETTVLYQRKLVTIIKDVLDNLGVFGTRLIQLGDDLMYKNPNDKDLYKLSVSIATGNTFSGLIHTAVNILPTPNMPLKIISLKEMYEIQNNVTESNESFLDRNLVEFIGRKIIDNFASEVTSIKRATTKVRSV